eukprot:TRINITY_DN48209_c0_g1_i1.p1 TRINITY_DN48209_c0_g1~~TRINITY_DN48209_c0_g1_i1.p1  ORF type:complete len:547 (-),score=60.07 TRINITY_DN48209_c0_g1_i1:133-1773(-)
MSFAPLLRLGALPTTAILLVTCVLGQDLFERAETLANGSGRVAESESPDTSQFLQVSRQAHAATDAYDDLQKRIAHVLNMLSQGDSPDDLSRRDGWNNATATASLKARDPAYCPDWYCRDYCWMQGAIEDRQRRAEDIKHRLPYVRQELEEQSKWLSKRKLSGNFLYWQCSVSGTDTVPVGVGNMSLPPYHDINIGDCNSMTDNCTTLCADDTACAFSAVHGEPHVTSACQGMHLERLHSGTEDEVECAQLCAANYGCLGVAAATGRCEFYSGECVLPDSRQPTSEETNPTIHLTTIQRRCFMYQRGSKFVNLSYDKGGVLVKQVMPKCTDEQLRQRWRDEEHLQYLQHELSSYTEELKRTNEDMARYKAQINTTLCGFFVDLVNKLIGFLASFLCDIIAATISAVGWGLDKLIAGALLADGDPVLFALQNSPECQALPTGEAIVAKFGSSLLSKVASLTLCQVGKDPRIGSTVQRAATKSSTLRHMMWTECRIVTMDSLLILSAAQVICGEFVSAFLTLLTPLILCNLDLGPDGAACQTAPCYGS